LENDIRDDAMRTKKSGSARRGPADPLAFVEFISIRLGARGLGGKKTELTAKRFHGALCEYGRPLRHALDDKLAKTRHFVKNYLSCFDQLMI
jgi:hypothetical protein